METTIQMESGVNIKQLCQKTRKKKKAWKQTEEKLLVEVWEQNIHKLRGARKNLHVYEDMRVELNNYGCVADVEEIKSKIHNLTTKYRLEKKQIGPSGGSPSEWPLYADVHNILGAFRINNVADLVEESFTGDSYQDYEFLDESLDSSSSLPSTTSTSKKKKNNFQTEILNKFNDIEKNINEQYAELKENDERMYQLELRKTELLEQYVQDSQALKNGFLEFLARN